MPRGHGKHFLNGLFLGFFLGCLWQYISVNFTVCYYGAHNCISYIPITWVIAYLLLWPRLGCIFTAATASIIKHTMLGQHGDSNSSLSYDGIWSHVSINCWSLPWKPSERTLLESFSYPVGTWDILDKCLESLGRDSREGLGD